MRLAFVITLLLLSVPLVGCLGDDADRPPARDPSAEHPAFPLLSAKRYDVLAPEEVWVASTVDGKRLNNVVFRPDTDEPVPVFINFSPYWADSAIEGGDNFAAYMIEEFVPRGYAFVLSAIRGTGHSEGCFQIAGDLELQDTYDVVDHFANAAWSNGKIGAGGKSYDSTTQNGMIAKVPHEALETLFHVSGITDMYRYNYRNGVTYGHGTIFNTYYYFQGTDEYGIGPFGGDGTLDDETPESLARIVDDAACPALPGMQASGIGSGGTGLKDDYWIERDWNRYIADSDWEGGIFFVHGLQDWNVKPDHILPWLELLSEDVEVKGWLHQWSRDPEGGHVYPMRTDWNLTMLRWLDHWLKDIDTGLLDEPRFDVQGSDGTWRQSQQWPPTTVQPRELPLDDLEALAGMTETVHRAGVLEAGSIRAFRYSGAPTLTLVATSTNEDPVLTATLCAEAPDGTLTWHNEGVLRAIYREGLTEPTPVPVGEPITYTLEFYPQDDILPAGHRWVLEVGSATRYAQPTPAQLTGIVYDLSTATLTLPLADAASAAGVQPNPMDCIAC